jgi:hypothetical protein
MLPAFSTLIAAGAALTRTGRPAVTAMLLLDALAPQGVTTLLSDSAGVIPALGALARLNPEAVVQALDARGLERLGVSFSLSGAPRAGRRAMRVKITPLGGGTTVRQEIEGGRLWVYPLPAGMRARVEVSARGGSIGGRSRIRMDVEGGTAGLIFDARGRLLPLANEVAGRAAQLPLWLADVTGDPVHTVDARAYRPAPAAPAKAEQAQRPARRAQARQPAAKEKAQPRRGRSEGRRKEARAPKEKGDDIDELRDLFS